MPSNSATPPLRQLGAMLDIKDWPSGPSGLSKKKHRHLNAVSRVAVRRATEYASVPIVASRAEATKGWRVTLEEGDRE
eukprot:2831722-Pyramimonas_sp.AAC.1